MSKNTKIEIDKNKYLSSKETMKELKVSSCHLMHLRESGKLKYVKKGNAYFYENEN